jgi:thiol-disulfide isomerase/thioredoxin
VTPKNLFRWGAIASFSVLLVVQIVRTFIPKAYHDELIEIENSELENFIPIDDGEEKPLHGTATFYGSKGTEKIEEKSLKEFEGKPVLVHFWAPWCKPCRSELPLFDAFVGHEKIVTINLVSDATDPSKTQEFFEEKKIKNLRVTLDLGGYIAKHYGIASIPTTILFGADGKEIGRFSGAVSWNKKEFAKSVRSLLKLG